MKILFIIETLGRGGAERVLVNTLPELQKQGIECEVAILFEIDDLAEELEANSIKVHRLNLSYKWNVIEGICKLNKLIKDNNYDIVHAHLFFAYFYTGLIKVFNKHIKTVLTFHNLAYNVYPANTFIKKIRKRLDEFIVNKLIDRKVAVSNEVKKHFEINLNISNIKVIFNSFPLKDIDLINQIDLDKSFLEKYGAKDKIHCFSITPGRLVKEKGHVFLLEAFKKLFEENLSIFHFIVGSGPLEKSLKNYIVKHNLTNVKIISSLNQVELFRLIKVCDCVIIPSISEGFPMVVGECMALNKSIIATNISGIEDMIRNEKEGLLVQPKDSRALANAIEKLYKDEKLRLIFAENASKRIRQFDTQVIAKQWYKFYEEMLNE